jgi:hypothetical protein
MRDCHSAGAQLLTSRDKSRQCELVSQSLTTASTFVSRDRLARLTDESTERQSFCPEIHGCLDSRVSTTPAMVLTLHGPPFDLYPACDGVLKETNTPVEFKKIGLRGGCPMWEAGHWSKRRFKARAHGTQETEQWVDTEAALCSSPLHGECPIAAETPARVLIAMLRALAG